MGWNPSRGLPEVVSRARIAGARKALPAREVVREAAEVFKLLGRPVRLSLLHALTHDELTVGDLAHAFGLSLTATSHQLALLRRARLVESRDEGRLTHYRAPGGFVGHMVHDCMAHVGERLGAGAPPHHHAHRLSQRRRQRKPRSRPASE